MSEPTVCKSANKKENYSSENSKNSNFSIEDDENQNDVDNFEENTEKSDFPTMIKDFFVSIPWRLSIGMFVLLVVLLSKNFTENVLFAMGGEKLVDGDCPTNTGTIVVCLLASLGLIIMDILIRAKLL